jgi:hypothetical protein
VPNATVGLLNIFQVSNGLIPTEGPRAVGISVSFGTGPGQYGTPLEIPLAQLLQQGKLSTIQTIFIDNSVSNFPLELEMTDTGQIISCPANSSGYFPVMACTQFNTCTLTWQGVLLSETGLPVKLYFINVSIQPSVWHSNPTIQYYSPGSESLVEVGNIISGISLSKGLWGMAVSFTGAGDIILQYNDGNIIFNAFTFSATNTFLTAYLIPGPYQISVGASLSNVFINLSLILNGN